MNKLPPITDLPLWAQEKIAEFNARPMRRVTDVRILGWGFIETAPKPEKPS